MDILVKILIEDSLNRAIKEYGIEGTEEVIKNVYTQNLKLQNTMLNCLKEKINR